MKKTLFILTMLALASASMAQSVLGTQGRHLTAIFSCATFNDPNGTPYVETYFNFNGNSLAYRNIDANSWQATIEMVLTVSRHDSVVHFKKYILSSPVTKLGNVSNEEAFMDYDMPNFIDMQRFSLPNGEYTLHFSLRDTLSKNNPVELDDTLVVSYSDHPQLSSVQPMESAVKTKGAINILSRNGYDMTPYINDFYPEELKQINFFYEIYNIDQEVGNKDFLTLAFIEQKETGSRFEAASFLKRLKSNNLVPVYGSIDISSLPSGNYNLVVEVRNSNNDLMLFHKVPFMRSNPSLKNVVYSNYSHTFASQITDEQLMNYYLSALYPIAKAKEDAMAEELARTPGNMAEKQAFFYQFWLDRDPLNPEGKWNEYLKRLNYVDKTFSYAKRRGYLTDRGRVYLQYGPPNFVRDEKNFVSNRYMGHGDLADPVTANTINRSTSLGQIHYLPYQLWRYNNLPGDDINRCFIFWDEQRSGHYLLLNSNAKGEVQDPGWERRLCQQQLPDDVQGDVGDQFQRGY